MLATVFRDQMAHPVFIGKKLPSWPPPVIHTCEYNAWLVELWLWSNINFIEHVFVDRAPAALMEWTMASKGGSERASASSSGFMRAFSRLLRLTREIAGERPNAKTVLSD